MDIIGSAQNAGPEGGGAAPIKDGTDQSFMADVIEASKEAPVVVDFWAPWCGPCKQLTPALEKAVTAQGGKVKLVKINIDENPAVAQQLRVQSIPTVYAFADGQPVDGFQGAVPESQINEFMERLSGKGRQAQDLEAVAARAFEALEAGDVGGAAQDFAAIVQADPSHVGALAGLAKCYLAHGDSDKAREIIDSIPADKRANAHMQSVLSTLDLQSESPAGDLDALKQAAEAAPDDLQARYDYADALASSGRLKEASDALLAIVEADPEWNERAARERLLKIFEAAGPASDVARLGRRRLSSILFA